MCTTSMSANEDSQNSERLCEGSADRISNLPPELSMYILQCLPLRDAARTSLLSRQWRGRWLSLPNIILDYNFFKAFLKGRHETELMLLEYMIVINGIILSHVGPISKFVLYIPRLFKIDKAISQWKRFICGDKSVKEFIIVSDKSGLKTNLPTHLFSCVGLTHLDLSFCELPTPPSTFTGFPCLIRIRFDTCRPFDCNSNVLEILISQCPQLRDLYIYPIEYFQNDLTIRAPKLQNLFVMGKLCNLHLEETPAIKTCMIVVRWKKWDHSCWHLAKSFTCLANVETLCLGTRDWETMLGYEFILPEKSPRELKQLKNLYLIRARLNCSTAVNFILCLLKACPHLEQLYLSVDNNEDNNVDHHPRFYGSLQSLKSVEICSYAYESHELQFMKLLLAHSPVLEIMTIELCTTVEEAEGRFNFANELLQYGRASPKAQIVLKANARQTGKSFSSLVNATFRG